MELPQKCAHEGGKVWHRQKSMSPSQLKWRDLFPAQLQQRFDALAISSEKPLCGVVHPFPRKIGNKLIYRGNELLAFGHVYSINVKYSIQIGRSEDCYGLYIGW